MFIILNFFISKILMPKPMSKIPPILVSPCMIAGVKNCDAPMANSVNEP